MNMKQSVMFRNNEDRVQKLFKNNKMTAEKQVVELEQDPRKIRLDTNAMHKNEEKN